MTRRMLIDAGHREETRVVVADGQELQEFDVESSSKSQLKGNIYLAKVTRVEPSLQAAFVDYGGNRHGFLAFSEIHPDYFQIPVSDREALAAEQARLVDEARDADESEADEEAAADEASDADDGASDDHDDAEDVNDDGDDADDGNDADDTEAEDDESAAAAEDDNAGDDSDRDDSGDDNAAGEDSASDDAAKPVAARNEKPRRRPRRRRRSNNDDDHGDDREQVARREAILKRGYKIQEVIKRRQILLVQVVKEERGNKGAALTTYMSIAGRYCVLMPNTPRGGGISRKIADPQQRRRLKTIAQDLNVPEGTGLIIRTAGMGRTKAEIKRDFTGLLKQWESIREETLKSAAPMLIYEEANIIKRAIRDLYTKDVDEVLVEGDEGYKMAKSYMRLLMPSHAKRVQQYTDAVPLFHKFNVEHKLDAMHSPIVQLKSGGYIVINPTEALVAIDINSGRSTKERNIEETALKTNSEAAVEIARQLRLRDLAGLIVIDFIDMDEGRNERAVERKLKEALKSDRARIQVGRISSFGLLELSRQRLRPSLHEALSDVCPHCGGSGFVRSIGSTALHVLRGVEQEGMQQRSQSIRVQVPTEVALYLLNDKRPSLIEIEQRYDMTVLVERDEDLVPPDFRVETVVPRTDGQPIELLAGSEAGAQDSNERTEADDGDGEDGGRRRKRRRKSRRRRGGDGERDNVSAASDGDDENAANDDDAAPKAKSDRDDEEAGEGRKRRRRGKRGGRRRRGRGEAAASETAEAGAETADAGNNDETQPGEETHPGEATASSDNASSDDEVKPEKKKRRSRAKAKDKKASEAKSGDDAPTTPEDSGEPAADNGNDEPAPSAETPARDDDTIPVATSGGDDETATVSGGNNGGGPVREPDPTPDEAAETPRSGPPRRGWWQKIVR